MKRKPTAGTYYLALQPKAKSRWKNSEYAEFEPNWIVRFHVPTLPVKAESSRLPVCHRCLEDKRDGREPRENCTCRKPVDAWAQVKLRALVDLWQKNRIDDLEKLMKPAARLTFAPVFEAYGRCTLESASDNLRALRLILEAPSGRAAETIFVDELKPGWVRRFVALYQEYGRRGWTERRERAVVDEAGNETMSAAEVTAQRWEQLRALKPEPAIDWNTAAKWNTTIRAVLRCAKAVLGPLAREKYLPALGPQLPPMRDFLEMRLSLPVPDPREGIDAQTFETILSELEKLREKDVRQWLAVNLAYQTGMRTVELAQVTTDWLEVMPAAGGAEMVVLVVKNRPEEGFRLKSRNSRRVRVIPLSQDVVEVITSLCGEGTGSVFALESKTAVENLLRDASSWIRSLIGESSTHTFYKFRKLRATAQTRVNGLQAGADALGHENPDMTRQHYVSPESLVRALSDADVKAAIQTERKPWKPAQLS